MGCALLLLLQKAVNRRVSNGQVSKYFLTWSNYVHHVRRPVWQVQFSMDTERHGYTDFATPTILTVSFCWENVFSTAGASTICVFGGNTTTAPNWTQNHPGENSDCLTMVILADETSRKPVEPRHAEVSPGSVHFLPLESTSEQGKTRSGL